jgi:hypothetical protein
MFLARQVLPEDSKGLYQAYLDATQRPHGYLVLDLAQDTDNRLRFRTNIFPLEYPPAVYAEVGNETNYSAFELLKNAKPKLRKANISNCDPNLLKSISECALNVLHGNVNLSGCS